MKFDAAPSILDALGSALEAFRRGDFDQAETEAEAALALDFEHPGVQSALKCAVFWKERAGRIRALPTPEGRGDQWLREWKGFDQRFRSHLDEPFDEGVAALRMAVHDEAAQAYLSQLELDDPQRHPELRLKAARAWKACGSFDRAIEVLDAVLEARADDAGALAELADCFEAVGEASRSKLFFREAFYLNPQAVDVAALTAPALVGLVGRLSAEGLEGPALKEWIPVRAVAEGLWSVKRDLKPLEVGQLKQSINSLKAEMHEGSGTPALVLPRLLNRYFWLIDHFLSVKEDRSRIEDVLLNIKLLDERIYNLYTR